MRFPPHPPSSSLFSLEKSLFSLPAWLHSPGGGTASAGTRCQRPLPTCRGTGALGKRHPGLATPAPRRPTPASTRHKRLQAQPGFSFKLKKEKKIPGERIPTRTRLLSLRIPVPTAEESLNDFPPLPSGSSLLRQDSCEINRGFGPLLSSSSASPASPLSFFPDAIPLPNPFLSRAAGSPQHVSCWSLAWATPRAV